MIFNLTPKSKIYMLCPTFSVTGGPESMHQFVDHMRRGGRDARFVFMPIVPDPMLKEFAHYDIKYTHEIEDDPANVLIAPEVMTEQLYNYRQIQKAVWWLSAVNHLKLKKERQYNWQDPRNDGIIHFAQSYFAADICRQHGVEQPLMLEDYLHHRYLVRREAEKRDQVAYFARKNAGVIEKLIEAAPDINWVPIQGMTAAQVRAVLSESKVYVDFGPHPGRDRMPREAAMQHCCLIIGNRGAAGYDGDFPFSNQFKFTQADAAAGFPVQNVAGVVTTIRQCFHDFGKVEKEFEHYRRWIVGQKETQRQQVAKYFGASNRRGLPEMAVKGRNYFIFYRDKVLKKLSGYEYPPEEEP
jgi:hypothetical protein